MFFHMVYKSGQIFLPFCHNARVWRTDRQTDRQTDRILIARPRLHFMQRGKNVQFSIKIWLSSLKPMFTPNHWHQTVVCYQAMCIQYPNK